VTIVLYHTIIKIKEHDQNFVSILASCGFFITIFLGSFAIGTLTALLVSFILKKIDAYNPQNRYTLEATCVILGPWFSYLISEACYMSGIVSILFCGIFMSRYTYPNLSQTSKDVVGKSYEVVAHASESLIFIFLGMGMFSFGLPFEKMGLGLFLVMLAAVLVGRAVNIFGNTAFLNMFRIHKISGAFQFLMWFSGLRGAIAFALAIDSLKRFPENGDVILTLTLLYAVITILLIGGAIAPLMHRYGVAGSDPLIDKTNEPDSSMI
jgi:NhaP-type Na+/H+ or K+/H+ antiporter